MAYVEVHMIDGTGLVSEDADVVFDGKENSVFVHQANGAYTNVNWRYVTHYHSIPQPDDVKNLDD